MGGSAHVYICHKIYTAIREKVLVLFFSPCAFWGLNLGPQSLGQVLYPQSHLVGSLVLVINRASYCDV